MQTRETAADGLERQAEVGADFFARHAQHQRRRREAAQAQALRQVEHEGCDTFLGAAVAEQPHHAVVVDDLAAHDLVKLALQIGELARQEFELPIADHADLRVFQRDRVARVHFGADAVEPEHLAGHLETGDLLLAIGRCQPRLEEARTDRVDRLEPVAGAKQGLAALDETTAVDKRVEPLEIVLGHQQRQAQRTQAAIGTGDAGGARRSHAHGARGHDRGDR